MNSERWREVEALFGQALDQPEGERRDFVRQAAGEDNALAQEVLSLLAAHDRSHEQGLLPMELAQDGEATPSELARLPGGDIKVGQALGDFELIREIGRGGMGVVFLARKISLPRDVALKVLPIHLLTTADTVERFSREGRSGARLQHPNIVSIYEVGATDEAHYIAMEHMPAGDLAQELKVQREQGPTKGRLHRGKTSGRFAQCATLIAQVAEGVHYAHTENLVHRDIKPQNLLVTKEGTLKLGDFGLVHDAALESMTEIGTLMGTAPYMSPEQASRSKQKVDKRTDIYSLGAVLYEMLTLRPAFEGDSSAEIIERITTVDPTPIRRIEKKIPFDLEVICQTAMARSPRDRYPTSLEFAKDLRRFLNHESIVARPPSKRSLVARHLRRRWRRYALLLAIPLSSLATMQVLKGQEARARRDALLRRTDTALQVDVAGDEAADSPFISPHLLHQWLATLTQERNALSPSQRDQLESLTDTYNKKLDAFQLSTLDLMETCFKTPKGIEPIDSRGIQEAFSRLRLAEALNLSREQQSQTELNPLDAIRPKVSVVATDPDGVSIPASVSLRELDPSTGAPRGLTDLGPTPLTSVPVALGFYRVIVTPAGQRPREYTRLIDRTVRDLEIRCLVRPGKDPRLGMAEIGPGEMTLPGEYGLSVTPHVGRKTPVAGFFIDRGAVTVGEYLEFHRSEGLPRPAFWKLTASSPEDPWPRLLSGDFDALPMTGVTWEEARDYAEWRGLRLVSDIERDYVARGPDGRLYPAPAGSAEEFFAGWPAVESEPGQSAVELALAYLKYALPSRGSDPTEAPPHEVEYLFGNVAEWTESLGTDFDGSTYRPALKTRVVAGLAWMERGKSDATLGSRYQWPIGTAFALPYLGFRCAASLTP